MESRIKYKVMFTVGTFENQYYKMGTIYLYEQL
jgi:hypothetical protein